MLYFYRLAISRGCILAGLLRVLCATPAVAWNGLGHKVVAEIAWQQLDAPTRRQRNRVDSAIKKAAGISPRRSLSFQLIRLNLVLRVATEVARAVA